MKLRFLGTLLLLSAAFTTGQAGTKSSPLPNETNSIGMTLVEIPAGTYLRGERPKSPIKKSIPRSINSAWHLGNEEPTHRVTIPEPLWVGATEVTVGQFQEFVRDANYRTAVEQGEAKMLGFRPPKEDAENDSLEGQIFESSSDYSWQNPGFEQSDSDPVVGVTYQDAEAFCQWLSKKEGVTYRLPTEAEWEYFCRAGSEGHFSFGNKPADLIHQHANIGDVSLEKEHPGTVLPQWVVDVERDPADGYAFTAPTASYQPNAWGLYDTHGNVWEWCIDQYRDTAYKNLVDAEIAEHGAPAKGEKVTLLNPVNTTPQLEAIDSRVIRGGSFYTGPVMARAAVRAFWVADDAACYVGFRVVRDSE